MRLLTTLGLSLVLVSPLMAQHGPCTEESIKEAHAKMDPAAISEDTYFFSGALDKPVIGKAALDKAFKPVSENRKAENYAPDQAERIVVSPSGDMAYEYGTEHISFDEKDSGKHVDFTAAYLRVWKAADGKCVVAAQMHEPEGHER